MKIARISGTLRTKLYSCTDVDLQDGGGPVMQAELDPSPLVYDCAYCDTCQLGFLTMLRLYEMFVFLVSVACL